MYNIIKNPETNRNVSIYSKKGIAILEKYLNNLTGGGSIKTLEVPYIPDEFQSDKKKNERLKEMISIINSVKNISENVDGQSHEKIMRFFMLNNKEYVNRNMLYFFVSSVSDIKQDLVSDIKQGLISNIKQSLTFGKKPKSLPLPFISYILEKLTLEPDEQKNIKQSIQNYNKQNNNFFEKININYLTMNHWNYEVKNLIYRFHLTNIISVLLILFIYILNILYIPKLCSSYKEHLELKEEIINIIDKLIDKENLDIPSSKNVESLILINDSLKTIFIKILDYPKIFPVLQDNLKKDLQVQNNRLVTMK